MKRAIILSLSVVFVVIGIHQSFTYGIAHSYFFFMFSVFFLFLLKFVKPDAPEEADEGTVSEKEVSDRPAKYKQKKRKRIGQ